MSHLGVLVVCLLLGLLLRWWQRLPETTPAVLQGFLIQIALPALTLEHVHALTPQWTALTPALMPWVLFGLGSGFFWMSGRLLHLSAARTGGLILVGALGNTAFVGLPMLEAFYGPGELRTGLLIDQLGSYLVLSTLGLLVAGLCASATHERVGATIARKVLRFPPFLALLLALGLHPVAYPPWVVDILHTLGATLTPLALVSIGFQLRLREIQAQRGFLALGLGFKLVLGPALILLLVATLLGTQLPHWQTIVFEAAMGPMLGATIVALDYDLDPPLVTLLAGLGIPLSLVTLPLWFLVLGSV